MGTVGRAGHIRCVEQLRCTQCIADTRCTVADGEDLIFPVNIGDLMYKSVSLGALQNFQNFLLCDVMAFSCFYQIICHITDTDAQISFDFAAAFAAHALLTAAGTGADCIFVLIFFQPVGDMLHTCGFLLCRNCLFYRNDMHSDSGASRRYHWCDLFQRQSGHIFKEICQNRVFFHLLFIHHHKFCAAGNKHRQDILLMMVGVLPVIFDHADHGHFIQQLLHTFWIFAGFSGNLFQCHWFSDLHGKTDLCHFISQNFRESPILGILHCDFHTDTVSDHLSQLQDQFTFFFHSFTPFSFDSFQELVSSFSQSIHSSMPSPVRAEIGMIFISGFSFSTRFLHSSRSKSK